MKGQNQRSQHPSPCSGRIRTFTSTIRKLLPIPGGRETMWWEWAGWEPSQGSQIRLLAKDTNNVISDQGLYSIRSTPSSDCYLGLLLYFDWLYCKIKGERNLVFCILVHSICGSFGTLYWWRWTSKWLTTPYVRLTRAVLVLMVKYVRIGPRVNIKQPNKRQPRLKIEIQYQIFHHKHSTCQRWE